MKSVLDPSFVTRFAILPQEIQTLARKNYQLWKQNPLHPSLQFKRVGKRTNSFSVRVGIGWRAVGVQHEDTMIWFWIGSHADYDRLLRSL